MNQCSTQLKGIGLTYRKLIVYGWALATFVRRLHENRRPRALTQRGRSVAVLMDVHEYEKMQERLKIGEEVYKAEEQIACNKNISGLYYLMLDECLLVLASVMIARTPRLDGCRR